MPHYRSGKDESIFQGTICYWNSLMSISSLLLTFILVVIQNKNIFEFFQTLFVLFLTLWCKYIINYTLHICINCL